jgi:integrase
MPIERLKDGRYRIRYYGDGTKGGSYRQETLDGVTAEEAKRIYRKRLAAASARKARGEAGERMTFAQLAEDYLATAGKRMAASSRNRAEGIIRRYLVPAFGAMKVEALRPIHIERYQAARLEKASPSTVVREWNTLRAILNFFEKYGHVNPIRRKAVEPPKADDRRTIYFEPHEWRAFIAAFDDVGRWRAYRAGVRRFGTVRAGGSARSERRHGAGMDPNSPASDEYLDRLRQFPPIFKALLYTGARLGEVLAMKWEDVDLSAGKVSVMQEKTGERKTVPIAAPLRAIFTGMQRGTPKAYVFARSDGHPFGAAEVQRAFKVAKKIAKLRDELTPHKLRHTFASWLVMSGTPLRTVQELLGHANITTTTRYAHLSPAHLAGAVENIEAMASEDLGK